MIEAAPAVMPWAWLVHEPRTGKNEPRYYRSTSSGGGTQNGLMVWTLMVNVDLGKTSTKPLICTREVSHRTTLNLLEQQYTSRT